MSWPAGANPFEINKGIFQLMTGINLVLSLGKGYARFFESTPGGAIAGLREVIQLLTRAVPLSPLRSPVLDKDEVHYRVPCIVNTCEE
jgi:hypothetical protein